MVLIDGKDISNMDEYYPILTEDSDVEQGYTVRISRGDTLVMILNIAIVLVEIIMYGFILLIILMGAASVIVFGAIQYSMGCIDCVM